MTNEEIIETILSREKETKNTKRLRAFIQEALTLKDAEFLEKFRILALKNFGISISQLPKFRQFKPQSSNIEICKDCNSLTAGRCIKHLSQSPSLQDKTEVRLKNRKGHDALSTSGDTQNQSPKILTEQRVEMPADTLSGSESDDERLDNALDFLIEENFINENLIGPIREKLSDLISLTRAECEKEIRFLKGRCFNWKVKYDKQRAEFLEFLENELWHLENQPEEIKITIRNIKQKIKELSKEVRRE